MALAVTRAGDLFTTHAEAHYIPASAAYVARADQRGKLGSELFAWQQKLAGDWTRVSFGPLHVKSSKGLDPGSVRVELFAEGRNGDGSLRKIMDRGALLQANVFLYAAGVEGNRPANDFTPRVIPYHPSASVPLEASQTL